MPRGRQSITLNRINVEPRVYLLIASAALCCGVYVPGASLRWAGIVLAAGFCCAAFGIACSFPSRFLYKLQAWRGPFLLLALSAGLIAGGVIQYTLARQTPFIGIPAAWVVRIEGVCEKDSTKVSSEKQVVPLAMERVTGRNGISAGASGTVTAFVSAETPFFRGERVVLRGGFTEDLVFHGALESGGENRYSHPLLQFRKRALEGIEKKIHNAGAASGPLFAALFLGVKDDLGTLEAELFKKGGCTHILALSGMHLGIISGLLFLVFRPVAGKRRTFFVVAVIVALYIGLTGFRSALVRAGLMFFLFGIVRISGRKGDIRSVFLLSFLILALLTPKALHTLSFQLSFLALGGILFLSPAIHSLWKSAVPDVISLPVSASVAAQTATAPVVAAAFGTIYPAGIISSMVITPLITLFMSGGIIALVIPFPRLAGVVFSGLDYLYRGILRLLDIASAVPALTVTSAAAAKLLWAGTALCLVIPAARAFRYRKQYRSML